MASGVIVAMLSVMCPDIEAKEPAPSTLATKIDASRQRSRLDEVNLQGPNPSFLFSRRSGADTLRIYQRIRDRDCVHASIAEGVAENELGARPFGLANTAVVIRSKVRLLPSWRSEDGVSPPFHRCARYVAKYLRKTLS